jgi:hypothetical protein
MSATSEAFRSAYISEPPIAAVTARGLPSTSKAMQRYTSSKSGKMASQLAVPNISVQRMNRTSSSVWIVKGAASSIEVDKAVAITAVIRVFILVFPLVAHLGR